MARCFWTFLLCLVTATAFAQAPRDQREEDGRGRARRGDNGQADDRSPGEEGERGDRGRGGPDGGRGGGPGGFFRRPNPMFEALDANSDGEINAAELRKAAAALKKLDADGDNVITLAEASPQGGPGGMFGGDPAQMVDNMMRDNDRNNDGKLSEDELPGFMGRMLESADRDGDGALSKEELTAGMDEMRNRFRGGGGPGGGFGRGGFDPQQMMQQMAQLDRNRDGKLSPQEVPEQMRQMLQGRDSNGDGAIDRQEMEAALQQMGERFRGGRGGPDGGYGDRGGRGDRGERGARGEDRGGEGEERGNRRGRPEVEQ
jgi:Ca2+-binding EF-hand superfamily protein